MNTNIWLLWKHFLQQAPAIESETAKKNESHYVTGCYDKIAHSNQVPAVSFLSKSRYLLAWGNNIILPFLRWLYICPSVVSFWHTVITVGSIFSGLITNWYHIVPSLSLLYLCTEEPLYYRLFPTSYKISYTYIYKINM